MINQQKDYSLLSHNTFGLDVKTSRFIEYDTAEELGQIIAKGVISAPYLHIGQGSNLLFTKDFEGVILHSRICGIEVVEEAGESVLLKVGAGVVWDDFVAYCVASGWYGVENLSDIPGEVGASAVQNIGAYGVETKDLITTVCTIDLAGKEKIYNAVDCRFSYRYSIFKEPHMHDVFITHVYFKLSKDEVYTLDYGTIREELKNFPIISLKAVREAIQRIRASKLPDPKVLGNAGSFFMNPIVDRIVFDRLKAEYPKMPFYEVDADRRKIPAGWLIEQSGWKGKALGAAAVHDRQALVLVNKGGADGSDILALSDAVRASVKERFGIDIKPEVKIIG